LHPTIFAVNLERQSLGDLSCTYRPDKRLDLTDDTRDLVIQTELKI